MTRGANQWLLVISTALAACAPLKTTYYEPLGQGTLRASGCPGPKSRLEMSLPGHVVLSLTAYPTDALGRVPGSYSVPHSVVAEGVRVHLVLSIPEASRLHFSSDALQIVASDRNEKVVIERIQRVRDARNFGATDEILGASYAPPSWSYSSSKENEGYIVELPLIRGAPPSFKLLLPGITVNGEPANVSPTEFHLRDDYAVHGLCP
jgi:hypothetical protein